MRIDVKRVSTNVILSVSDRGEVRFMTYWNSMKTRKLTKFVGRLAMDLNRKIFTILDNLAIHHSKKFKIWLDKKKEQVKGFLISPHTHRN